MPPPPLLTIDTLSILLKSTILHPFPYLLLFLISAVTSPSSSFASLFSLQHSLVAIPVPNAPTLLLATAVSLTLVRGLLSLDACLANHPRRRPDWSTEVVLITGGLGGLGRCIAEIFALRGVAVAILDVRCPSEAEREELESRGIKCWGVDVGDFEAVGRVLESVVGELGAPTIYIHTAAIVTGAPLTSLTPTQLLRHYRTNVLSHHHLITLTLPHMLHRKTGGHIITISSVLGYLGCAGLGAYTASKAALTALHNSLTAELALMSRASAKAEDEGIFPRSVKTLLVTPGQLSTPLFAAVPPPRLAKFLGPTVEVHELAREVVRKIDEGVGGEVSLPEYAKWISLMGLLPEGLRGWVRGLAGLDGVAWGTFGGVETRKREGEKGETRVVET